MITPSLNDNEIQQVFRILRTNGQGPDVIRKVARQYHVAESLVSDLGKIITEGAGTVLTETSSASTVQESHKQSLAAKLVDQVKIAESRESLAHCSGQDLEALAAAYYGS